MSREPFKIHPAPLPDGQEKPKLDPSKAPWSSPRGFATSISEETAEWKRLVRAHKQPVKPIRVTRKEPTQKLKSKFSFKAFLKKPFVAMYNYFQTITFSEECHEDINIRAHRYIGYLCCIRADVNAAIHQ